MSATELGLQVLLTLVLGLLILNAVSRLRRYLRSK